MNLPIFAGAQDLRSVAFRLWPKQPGVDFDTGYYTYCNPCTGMRISYLPANSYGYLDSTTGEFLVRTADGRVLHGERQVYDLDGLPFDGGMDISCGEYYLGIETDAWNTGITQLSK